MSEDIYTSPTADLQQDDENYERLTLQQILFSFKGRIGRKIYWLSFLGMMLTMLVVVGLVAAISLGAAGIVALILYIPLIWISLAISAKRWHDRDKSAWWILIAFVPIIGIWALIENGFLAGEDTPNRFGHPNI